MDEISYLLKSHYREKFLSFGATTKGVDWGDDEYRANSRNYKMLEITKYLKSFNQKEASVLDVGCGYGALLEIIQRENINVTYSGIDLVPEMIGYARKRYPATAFFEGDILEFNKKKFDFVVSNGILTQKMMASQREMDKYANKLIKKMFNLSNLGIVFNLMTTHVNFQNERLYYRNPSEMLAWCMSELSPCVKLDAAYDPWFEYSVFVFKEHVSQ